MLGTGLLIFSHVELHLVPWQVGRELFASRLCLGLLATLVAVDRFEGCIGDPLGRIDDVGRVAEVDNELLRVGQIALDLLAEGQLERGIPLRLKL